MVRLFGALQTKEIRDEKIQLIDRRIAEEGNKVDELEKSLKYDFCFYNFYVSPTNER